MVSRFSVGVPWAALYVLTSSLAPTGIVGRVVGVAVEGRARGEDPGGRLGRRSADDLLHLGLVHALGQRLADAEVVGRGDHRVEHDEGEGGLADDPGLTVDQLEARTARAREVGDRGGVGRLDHVDPTRPEGGLPLSRVGDGLEGDRVEVGETLPPVVGIAGGGEEVVRLPLRVDERSGAHGDQRAGPAGGGFLDHGLADRVADLGGEAGGEGRVGAGEREDDGHGRGGGDRHHLLEGRPAQRRGQQGVEVGLDHRRSEQGPVAELDARPQRHRPHFVGGVVGHRLGQVGLDAAVGGHCHQRIEDGVGVEETVGVPVVGGGVEPVDLGDGPDGQRTSADRRSLAHAG